MAERWQPGNTPREENIQHPTFRATWENFTQKQKILYVAALVLLIGASAVSFLLLWLGIQEPQAAELIQEAEREAALAILDEAETKQPF